MAPRDDAMADKLVITSMTAYIATCATTIIEVGAHHYATCFHACCAHKEVQC